MSNHPTKVTAVSVATQADRSGFYALGMVISYAMHYQQGKLNRHYQFCPIRPFDEDQIEFFLAEQDLTRPGIFLFSVFCWNQEASLKAAKAIREKSPQSVLIFGGANVPRRREETINYFEQYQDIDIAVIGEGEETLAELLDCLSRQPISRDNLPINSLLEVAGLYFRNPLTNTILGTSRRALLADLNVIPSPYLNGLLDPELLRNYTIVPLDTTRGCPFGCTFCDWGGQTLSKVRKFDKARIIEELQWFKDHGIDNIALTDANFGIFQRDVEITDWVANQKKQSNWPRVFATNVAKNSADRVTDITLKLNDVGLTETTIAVAFQSFDETTLNIIDRKNIKISQYEKMIREFRKAGINKICGELVFGLPGQTVESFANDLQKCFEWMLHIRLHKLMVMPNAPMGDPAYLEKYQIVIDEDNFAISSFSYSEQDYQTMKWLHMLYTLVVHHNLLKFILIYYQIEHQLDAALILYKLIQKHQSLTDDYPFLHWLCTFAKEKVLIKNKEVLFTHWQHEDGITLQQNLDKIIGSFFDYIDANYGTNTSASERESLLKLQKSCFVHYKRKIPDAITAPHDVVAYFQQIQQQVIVNLREKTTEFKSLKDFGAGLIETPAQKIRLRMGFLQQDINIKEWDLKINGLEYFYNGN